jgi:hypothetical protein
MLPTNPTRYLVVGCPRSGTTAVHLALSGHPQVSALSDEMRVLPFFDKGLATFTVGHETEEERRVTQRALFDAITSIDAAVETHAIGLKICAQSPYEAGVLVNALRTNFPDAKVVLTDRSDLVAQYGSLQTARRTGVWHSWEPSAGKAEATSRRINRWMFVRYALECLDTMRVLRTLEQSHSVFVCKYEALLADAGQTYRSVFSFIGLADLEVTWSQARKVMPPPQRYIANYDELTGTLADLRERHARGAISPLMRGAFNVTNQGLRVWFRLAGDHSDTGPD